MAPVRETHAEWFTPASAPIPAEQIERDEREYALAEVILCGSDYAAGTIRRYATSSKVAGKLRTLPYCYDEALFGAMPAPQPVPRTGPIRFLFTGELSMRKGIHHALEAIAALPASEAELTLVGNLHIPPAVFARFADRVTHLRTVPRAAMPDIMARHHVLVFPSYFEGSALSLLEGLASGPALIQTPQAGNGVTPETGILLERPDTDQLVAAMLRCIEERDRLDAWRRAAQHEAGRYTFARYRENIAALLAELEI
jgi:glycosyltransferase involved in cell wall biosynthesis